MIIRHKASRLSSEQEISSVGPGCETSKKLVNQREMSSLNEFYILALSFVLKKRQPYFSSLMSFSTLPYICILICLATSRSIVGLGAS